jgi:hypothetical protein
MRACRSRAWGIAQDSKVLRAAYAAAKLFTVLAQLSRGCM